MRNTLASLFVYPFLCFGQADFPFDYDLHLSSIAGENDRTMICFHGYGANYEIADFLKERKFSNATLVSFNFPDHDIQDREYEADKASFGTMNELLPALYVMKQTVLGQGLNSIDLYGFSAGGGVVINVIAVLNTSSHDAELKKIGIGAEEKKKLLSAIERGVIILDTPLKSIEEIIALRGSTEEFEILAKNYRDNSLRPIDSLELLKGLSLNILLHFQKEDEILSNRDDGLYIERLKRVNAKGKVTVIVEDDGGHMTPHHSLWRAYTARD
jgi:hypothetical protein